VRACSSLRGCPCRVRQQLIISSGNGNRRLKLETSPVDTHDQIQSISFFGRQGCLIDRVDIKVTMQFCIVAGCLVTKC
jgi:hypothetical protein